MVQKDRPGSRVGMEQPMPSQESDIYQVSVSERQK